MNKPSASDKWLSAGAAIIAFTIGYFAASDPSRIAQLEDHIGKLESELAQSRPSRLPPRLHRFADAPSSTPAQSSKATNNITSDPLNEMVHQRQALSLSNLVASTALETSDEYSALFQNLGLNADDTERFKSNLVALHHGAIQAGEAMLNLLKQRHQYDQQIRSALGQENYKVYRSYEESKPAVREYTMFKEFCLKNKNIDIDPDFATSIVQLIKAADATTTITGHGPYDPPPQPMLGKESALEWLATHAEKTRQNSATLLQHSVEAGVDPAYVDLLKEYYASKIREDLDAVKVISRPPEEDTREILRTIDEQAAQQHSLAGRR